MTDRQRELVIDEIWRHINLARASDFPGDHLEVARALEACLQDRSDAKCQKSQKSGIRSLFARAATIIRVQSGRP